MNARSLFVAALCLVSCTAPVETPIDAGPDEPECLLSSDCSSGQYCRNGFCRFDCRQDRDCELGKWCDLAGRCIDPPVTPDAGPQCDAGSCEVGAKECVGESIRTCRADEAGCGVWGALDGCPVGQACSERECRAVPCREGDLRCGSEGRETCDSTGTYVLLEPCAQGCIAGVCSEVVFCTPGALRCVDTGRLVQQRCGPDGQAWLFERSCRTTCTAGICDDPCTDGERRCDGDRVMQCTGGTFVRVEDCPRSCRAGACLLAGLRVEGGDRELSGEINVDGDAVIVFDGRIRVRDPKGLTLRADRIQIDSSSGILADPAGTAPGKGDDGKTCVSSSTVSSGGGGGSHGAKGTDSEQIRSSCNPLARAGTVFGSDRDGAVAPGGAGGSGAGVGAGRGGKGGGVVRLIAKTITIEGEINVDGEGGVASAGTAGGGGGGSGGGILLSGNTITIAPGSKVSARGGQGAVGTYIGPASATDRGSAYGGEGGLGRVKLLAGVRTIDASAIAGVKAESLAPPLEIVSSTHVEEAAWYNDGGPVMDVAWTKPFEGASGYLWTITKLSSPTAVVPVPTQASGRFTPVPAARIALPGSELVTPPASATYALLVVSLDASARAGTVAAQRLLNLNALPPTVSSASHPSGTFTNKTVALLNWADPVEGGHWPTYRWVLDQKGDTVPGAANGTVTRDRGLVTPELAPGWWVLHVVSLDKANAPTRNVKHYRFGVGATPGRGTADVTVKSRASGQPITAAKVTLNDGLETATGGTNGVYRFSSVYAGTYEVVVVKPGFVAGRVPLTIVASQTTPVTVELDPAP